MKGKEKSKRTERGFPPGKEKYDVESFTIYEGLTAVRKCPTMYVEDTGTKGLHHLVYEVLDNSIDEAMAGYCDWIRVVRYADGSVSVEDNGRGIPINVHPKYGMPGVEIAMTKLHAGGKFDKTTYKVSGDLHGVGVSVVNALSQWLRVEVIRNGRKFVQWFNKGRKQKPKIWDVETEKTGTKVVFMPDKEIFEDIEFDFNTIVEHVKEVAFLNKNVNIEIYDEETDEERQFLYKGGVTYILLAKTYRNKIPRLKERPVSSSIRDSIPDYTLTHKLGSGGNATVYKAKDPYGRFAALKIPKGIDGTIDMSIVKKFETEAALWRKLSHPNIVKFYSSGASPVPYITMEVMEGGSLGALMKNHRLTVGESVDIMLQILGALSHAHLMATVHRDIKPENILFSDDGIPKLSDWGIGKFMATQSATKTMGTKGTLSYSSPEQISKEKYGSVDWSTDIFQLGIVFYEMLTGVNPFSDDDTIGIMSKISTEEPEPPSNVNPEIPEELDRIVMQALEKRKENRWSSGEVMLDRVRQLVGK